MPQDLFVLGQQTTLHPKQQKKGCNSIVEKKTTTCLFPMSWAFTNITFLSLVLGVETGVRGESSIRPGRSFHGLPRNPSKFRLSRQSQLAGFRRSCSSSHCTTSGQPWRLASMAWLEFTSRRLHAAATADAVVPCSSWLIAVVGGLLLLTPELRWKGSTPERSNDATLFAPLGFCCCCPHSRTSAWSGF